MSFGKEDTQKWAKGVKAPSSLTAAFFLDLDQCLAPAGTRTWGVMTNPSNLNAMNLHLWAWLALLGLSLPTYAQTEAAPGPVAEVSRVSLVYRGDTVQGRCLRVRSLLPLPADSVWAWVQHPALLVHVARGRVRFVPQGGAFPPRWQVGDTVATRMRLYGWLPFGGWHYLLLTSRDAAAGSLQTREWDRAARVWNHRITIRPHDATHSWYEDEIVIYGGMRTSLITAWAKGFYRHRQRRWAALRSRADWADER